MYTWSLKNLYLGLDDPKFKEDNARLKELIAEIKEAAPKLSIDNATKDLEAFLLLYEDLDNLVSKVAQFLNLTLATDVTNKEFNNAVVVLRKELLQTTLPLTLFEKFIAKIPDLDSVINKSEFLKEYEFFLKEIKDNSKYLLSEAEEVLAAEMNQSGGGLFSKMQGDLVSTLSCDYEGKSVPFSTIRNLAYDESKDVRKKAYEIEKESLKTINQASAFAMNGIKKEVSTIAKKRGYASALEGTLKQSRINQDVLDALLQAMNEYLPEFRKYMRRKGELLGHNNGLPFYDLFAPMGSSNTKYTVEEAQEFILKNFKTFSDDLHDLAKRAFTEDWIDYLPRKGKRGGAFCSSIYPLRESRILTNFDGNIGDISTIAHELGHAYHNFNIYDERILNTSYPMPIAETASILCETIVKKAVLKDVKSDEEKLGILEQELQDSNQVIVDILSRYLFETEVFKRSENEFLDNETLDKIMIDAQLASYGDGLDPEYLHEGMWVAKNHYYSTGRSFYNFPYAFGLLFSKGIYAQYMEKGSAFVSDIKTLLSMTGKATLMDVAASINIDITNVDFWRSSLEVIKEDIQLFLDITK